MVSLALGGVVLAAFFLLLACRPARRRGVVALGALATALSIALAVLCPFDARKFVGLSLMPLGLVWVGLIVAAALALRLSRRRVAVTFGCLALGLTAAGNPWLGGGLIRWLDAGYAGIDPLQEGSFDAVAVLGGGIGVGPDGIVTLSESSNRVIVGARLYRHGRTPLLVTTGPWIPLNDGRTTSIPAATARFWALEGIPSDAVLEVPGPLTTGDEAASVADLARERGWRRVGVVTSTWHLRRAMRLFQKHGIEAVPLPSGTLPGPKPPQLRNLVPQAEGVLAVQKACWEIIGAIAGQ